MAYSDVLQIVVEREDPRRLPTALPGGQGGLAAVLPRLQAAGGAAGSGVTAAVASAAGPTIVEGVSLPAGVPVPAPGGSSLMRRQPLASVATKKGKKRQSGHPAAVQSRAALAAAKRGTAAPTLPAVHTAGPAAPQGPPPGLPPITPASAGTTLPPGGDAASGASALLPAAGGPPGGASALPAPRKRRRQGEAEALWEEQRHELLGHKRSAPLLTASSAAAAAAGGGKGAAGSGKGGGEAHRPVARAGPRPV